VEGGWFDSELALFVLVDEIDKFLLKMIVKQQFRRE
jgi:hypothetical protein